MSVKQLHPDARSLIQARFDDAADVVQRAERFSAMSPGIKYLHRLPDDFDTQLAIAREAKNLFREWLHHPTFWSASNSEPLAAIMSYDQTKGIFGRKVPGIILVHQNAFYTVNGPYEVEEAKLILLDALRNKKRKAEYLVARKDVPESELGYERQSILEEVRHEVWRRDRGRCSQCGSVHNLEFDHVIPVSRGGANTARNIQLLCEQCNRRKSNNIG